MKRKSIDSVSAQGIHLAGNMVQGVKTANPGDFVAVCDATGNASDMHIDQTSGSMFLSGANTNREIAKGVAYGDGQDVYSWSGAAYQLSYVSVGSEGQSRGDDGSFKYFIKDHLGSTRVVLAEDFTVQQSTNYYAYGAVNDLTTPITALKAREKFTGKEYDEDMGIGLTYFGKRFYDQETGVWTACDPQEEFWNAYSYCGGNPINYIDPNGEDIAGALIGIFAGATISGGITYAETGDWKAAGWMALWGGTLGGMVGGYFLNANGWFTGIGAVAEKAAPELLAQEILLLDQPWLMLAKPPAVARPQVAPPEVTTPKPEVVTPKPEETTVKPELQQKGTRVNPDGTKKSSFDQLKQMEKAQQKAPKQGPRKIDPDKAKKSQQNHDNDLKQFRNMRPEDAINWLRGEA